MICNKCGTPCSECQELQDRVDKLEERERAARAHFRRACEKLEQHAYRTWDKQSTPADVWQVEIMVEVNKEKGEKKP